MNIKIKNTILLVIAYLYKPILKIKYKIYKNKRNNIKKRLFSTTGNISLVNAITLIKQLNEQNCEDYLIINSNGNDNFWETNMSISSLHNFKKIIKIHDIRFSTGFLLSNIYKIDEIYSINHPFHLDLYKEIFGDVDINLIDEGIGSLINYGLEDNSQIKAFYTNKYIDKIDGLGFSNDFIEKFKPLSTDIFKNIAKILVEKYPILPAIDKTKKNILYCGNYWYGSGLSKEEFETVQDKLVNDLINQGYNVLYKPHPRDTQFERLKNNPNVTFINSMLPIEVYNLDMLAVVSICSATSILVAHYWNIPGFSNVQDKTIQKTSNDRIRSNLIRMLIEEYSPNYKYLLDFDVKNMSKNDLKVQIHAAYQTFLLNKANSSVNHRLLQNF